MRCTTVLALPCMYKTHPFATDKKQCERAVSGYSHHISVLVESQMGWCESVSDSRKFGSFVTPCDSRVAMGPEGAPNNPAKTWPAAGPYGDPLASRCRIRAIRFICNSMRVASCHHSDIPYSTLLIVIPCYFSSSANARPVDSFCIFRQKMAKRCKKALDFLFRFIKNILTLDNINKSHDNVKRLLSMW